MVKKQIWDVHRMFSDDFTVVNDSLLLCKFCDTIVNWKKISRVQEHLQTKKHCDKKKKKLKEWMEAAVIAESEEDENDLSQDDQYSLKWSNHQNNMLTALTRLYGTEQLTDVVLAVEGRTIRGHKVILSACSSYFESLFLEFNEKNQIIILKDMPYADVSAIVEFMYRGEINISQGQLASLLKTAEVLKVTGLAEVSALDKSQPDLPSFSAGQSTPLPSVHASTIKPEVSREHQSRKRVRSCDSDSDALSKMQCSKNSLPITKPSGMLSNVTGSTYSWTPERLQDPNMPEDSSSFRESTPFREATPSDRRIPFTEETIKSLGVIKLNDYVKSGTRQQFWEEYFVKVIMQAIRNKELDMKGGAELLGVPYGSLYSRYRELFGYVKQGWLTMGGRQSAQTSASTPPAAFLSDPSNQHVLDQLRDAKISIKQAAVLMGIDANALALQISSSFEDHVTGLNFDVENLPDVKMRRVDTFSEEES